jgi:uncharacterized membrane protein YkvI
MYLADRWVEAFFEKVGYVGIAGIIFYTLVVLLVGTLLGATLNNRAHNKQIESSENKKDPPQG